MLVFQDFQKVLKSVLKYHCQANSLKGIFLTKGNMLLYHTKCILDINNMMKFYKKISIIYNRCSSSDTAHCI